MKNTATLLYVEDDLIVQENFAEIFRTYFKKVITTDDGNAAMKIFESETIDVAILDISIHGINGLSVASKILISKPDTLVYMISAYSDKEKLLQAVNLNILGYLVKPISHNDLQIMLQKINEILRLKSTSTLTHNYKFDGLHKLISHGESKIKLSKTEIKIIQVLIENKGKFMNSCDLHTILFPDKDPRDATCNNVTQLLSRLKKKVFDTVKSDEYFIENCYGLGYKIIVKTF